MGTHTLAPGTVLGRYELLLPIAQGGMATVWAARQRGSRGFARTVAIKTILPSLSDDTTFEQMFLDEAAIASRIHHANVVEIYDLGEEDEVLYLVMEWVDGEALSTLAKQAKKNGDELPLRVTLRILSQACAGLHAAHELRDDQDRLLHLVHRDVSPQNILVSSTGAAKLVDFGVAKSLAQGGQTTVGQLKGKVPFMSPEQARGADLDRRTDTFAMGTILYRLTTGTHPFLDDSDVRTMRNIISRPVIPPRSKNPRITPELEAVILRALQKDPAARFQTAAELGDALDSAMLSLGGPVPVEEVATYVRATLGDRDRKRRAAIRDAVLRIEEQSASSAPRESVSSILLTQTSTPPAELGAEPDSGGRHRSVSTRPSSPPTLQAVTRHHERRGPRRTVAAALGLVLAVGAVYGGASLWRARTAALASRAPADATLSRTPSSSAATSGESGAGLSDAPRADAEGDAPALTIDQLPDVHASTKPSGLVSASSPTPVRAPPTRTPASVTPTSSAPTGALPTITPAATSTATSAPAATGAEPPATSAPTATSTAQAPTSSPPPPDTGPKVPSVQDPGF